MSTPSVDADPLSSVAQHVRAGNRSMARLELDSHISLIADQSASWIWKAWLAESPDAALAALQTAHRIDQSNEVVAAGLKFVQGLLDWKPVDNETDFDIDPELFVDPNHDQPVEPIQADFDLETDFDVDPELIVGFAGDQSIARGHDSLDAADSRQPTVAPTSIPDCDPPTGPILVVDDSPTVRRLVSLTLSTVGHEVITAADGAEALEKIANRRPALVLSDTVMPKLDGYELCRLIKKHETTHDIPVILLSENDGVAERLRTSMVGCRDYVAKPFQSQTLIEKVGRQTGLRRESEQPDNR